jgi:hypothetical protein
MRPQSTHENSDKPSNELGSRKDRYEVRKVVDDRNERFKVIDKHQANAVVGAYHTFRQASIECTFLRLLYLKSMHKY